MVEREKDCYGQWCYLAEPTHMVRKIPPEKQLLGDGTHKSIEQEVVRES